MADQPTLDEFEAECLTFLEANANRKRDEGEQKFVWGEGDDDVAMFEEVDRAKEQADLARAKEWRAKRFDAGLGYITGAAQYGGRELPGTYDRLYSSLEGRYDVPGQGFFGIGLGMVAPTIKDHAQDHIKERYLPAMYRADLVGCQLFSEPGAGSDLAGLQTKADRDGTSGSSPGRRCGRPAPSTPTSARSSAALIRISPSTRASPASSSTCTRRAWSCGRCVR
jgi:acyl-CoA dehydrogenase